MENANAEPVGDDDNRPLYKLLLTCPSGLSPSQVGIGSNPIDPMLFQYNDPIPTSAMF